MFVYSTIYLLMYICLLVTIFKKCEGAWEFSVRVFFYKDRSLGNMKKHHHCCYKKHTSDSILMTVQQGCFPATPEKLKLSF